MKVFVNAYLEHNLGDDLFLDILVNRYPDHKYYIMSSSEKQRENVKVYSNELFNKIIRRLELKKILANRCDVIVSIGGSMYMEQKNDTNKKFYLGKKPYYILGSNFGPYHTQTYYENVHKFFEKAEDVCFREKYSYDLFSDIPQVRYASDIVFTMDTSSIKKTNRKRAIISIISCTRKLHAKYEKIYQEKIIQITKKLLQKQYEICYMSFCKEEKDEEAIENILSQLDEETKKQIQIYYYRGNRLEALQELADSQIIVGTRFHATILGILLEKVTIPIIYSDKTKNILEDMNYKGKSIDIRKMEKCDINEVFSEENLNYKLEVENLKKDAQRQFEKLDEVLKRSKDE